jgi:3-oxocholest-4-en-26-oyl-CoA dehydrogenase alpha subunit
MDFRLSPDEEAFRGDVNALLAARVTAEVLSEADSGLELGPAVRGVLRELGARRWLAPSWPEECGGMGSRPTYTAIVENALAYFRVLPAGRLVGVGVAGPMIMRFGSEEQKQRILPKVARGEVEFCLAYTEPQAGSDLGALQTRAWRDGDEYVIDGHKLFNTRAHYADYHWLIARTDSTGAKRAGYTFFIVDSSSPGITVQRLTGLSDKRTNAVFYDRVRVPADNVLGEEGKGWDYMTSAALAFERVFPTGDIEREFEDLRSAAREVPLAPALRQRLAEIAIRIEISKMLAWRITWMQDRGVIPGYEADTLKVFLGELWQDFANCGLQILGLHGALKQDSACRRLAGRFSYLYLDTVWRTVAGGTSEVMRNLVATRGLGLPRQ